MRGRTLTRRLAPWETAQESRTGARPLPSPETILKLAQAITSDSNVLMIDDENVSAGYRTLYEAVESGQAFAVDVRSDVLAIDFDTPIRRDRLEQLAFELVEAGMQPVRIASGSEGHEHLFAVVGPDRDLWIRRAKDLGLATRTGGAKIRPPLSPHRSGIPVRLISPSSVPLALDYLDPRYAPTAEKWARLLREGTLRGRRSDSLISFLLYALNDGADQRSVWRSLTDPANKLGEKICEKSKEAASEWFLGAWETASQRFRAAPPIRDRGAAFETLSALLLKIDDAFWPGRAGARKKKVLRALLDEANRRGSLRVAISQRAFAEATGLSPCRMRETVAELEGTWFDVDRSKKPTVYVLYDACCVSVPITPYTPPIEDMVDVGTVAQQNHDVFRGRSGLIRWQIYETLCRGPARASAIATHLAVNRSTVSRHLREMTAAGLAVQGEEWEVGPASLDEAAFHLGTTGLAKKQMERHEAERDEFAKWKRDAMASRLMCDAA